MNYSTCLISAVIIWHARRRYFYLFLVLYTLGFLSSCYSDIVVGWMKGCSEKSPLFKKKKKEKRKTEVKCQPDCKNQTWKCVKFRFFFSSILCAQLLVQAIFCKCCLKHIHTGLKDVCEWATASRNRLPGGCSFPRSSRNQFVLICLTD